MAEIYLYTREVGDPANMAIIGVIESKEPLMSGERLCCELYGGVAGNGTMVMLMKPGEPLPLPEMGYEAVQVTDYLQKPVWPGYDNSESPETFGGHIIIQENQCFEGETGFRYVFVSAMRKSVDLLMDLKTGQRADAVLFTGTLDPDGAIHSIRRESVSAFNGSAAGQIFQRPIWGSARKYRLNSCLTPTAIRKYHEVSQLIATGTSAKEIAENPEYREYVSSQHRDVEYVGYLTSLHRQGLLEEPKFLLPEDVHAEQDRRRDQALRELMLRKMAEEFGNDIGAAP